MKLLFSLFFACLLTVAGCTNKPISTADSKPMTIKQINNHHMQEIVNTLYGKKRRAKKCQKESEAIGEACVQDECADLPVGRSGPEDPISPRDRCELGCGLKAMQAFVECVGN